MSPTLIFVILSAAKDLTERSDTGVVAAAMRYFAAFLRACECFVRSSLFHLILRSVAKRSVSKDGNAKNGAAAIMRCIGTVPVATLRDTPLRSVPQGEVGVQPSAERFTSSQDDRKKTSTRRSPLDTDQLTRSDAVRRHKRRPALVRSSSQGSSPNPLSACARYSCRALHFDPRRRRPSRRRPRNLPLCRSCLLSVRRAGFNLAEGATSDLSLLGHFQAEQRRDVAVLEHLGGSRRGASVMPSPAPAISSLSSTPRSTNSSSGCCVEPRADAVQHRRDVLAHVGPVRAAARQLDLAGAGNRPSPCAADPLHDALGQAPLQQLDQRVDRPAQSRQMAFQRAAATGAMAIAIV